MTWSGSLEAGDVRRLANKSLREQQAGCQVFVTAGRAQDHAGVEVPTRVLRTMLDFELKGLLDRDEVGVGQRGSVGQADPADGRDPNRRVHAAKYLSAARHRVRQLAQRD